MKQNPTILTFRYISLIFTLFGLSTINAQVASPQNTTCSSSDAENVSLQYFDGAEVRDIDVDQESGILALTLASEPGVQLHDPDRSETIHFIRDRGFGTNMLEWSPNRQLIASFIFGDGNIAIWNVENGQMQSILEGRTPTPTPPVQGEASGGPGLYYYDVAWSPDGTRLAAIGSEPLRVWDVESQQVVFQPNLNNSYYIWRTRFAFLDLLAWSPDGNYLAMPAGLTEVLIWDTTSWQEVELLPTNLDMINTLAWSEDGYLFVGGGGGRSLEVWDTTTWRKQALASSSFPFFHVYSSAWSPDQCLLAFGTDGRIYLLYAADLRVELLDETDLGTIYDLAWSPDGTRIYAVGGDGLISE